MKNLTITYKFLPDGKQHLLLLIVTSVALSGSISNANACYLDVFFHLKKYV